MGANNSAPVAPEPLSANKRLAPGMPPKPQRQHKGSSKNRDLENGRDPPAAWTDGRTILQCTPKTSTGEIMANGGQQTAAPSSDASGATTPDEPVCEPVTKTPTPPLSKDRWGSTHASGRYSSGRNSVSMSALFSVENEVQFKGMAKSAAADKHVKRAIASVDSPWFDVGNSKPAHLGRTRVERLKLVLRQFPKHIAVTNLMCVLPILAGCVPIALSALHARHMVDSLPELSATYSDFESTPFVRPLSSALLQGLVAFTNRTLVYIMYVIVLCALYPHKIVLPLTAKFGLPFWLLSCGFAGVDPLMHYGGVLLASSALDSARNLLGFFGAGLVAWRVGKVVNDATLWWKITFLFVLPPVIMMNVYRYVLLPRISMMGDWSLLLLAAFVNPLLFEVTLIMARQVARSLHVHDESVRGIVPCAAMTSKKCVGRYICYLISDPAIATLASLLLAFFEVLFAMSVAVRDKMVYQMQAHFAPLEDKHAAISAVMKHEQNKLLRIRNAHNETTLEIVFSTTGLVLILAYGVSLNGETLPSAGSLASNFAVQWLSELFVDFLVIAWLTVINRQPVLETSHQLFRGWTALMCVFAAFGNGFFMCSVVIQFTYARVAGEGPYWFLLTENVESQMFNYTTLCNMYPSDASPFC